MAETNASRILNELQERGIFKTNTSIAIYCCADKNRCLQKLHSWPKYTCLLASLGLHDCNITMSINIINHYSASVVGSGCTSNKIDRALSWENSNRITWGKKSTFSMCEKPLTTICQLIKASTWCISDREWYFQTGS